MELTKEVDGRDEACVEYAEVHVCLPSYASDRHRSDEYDDCAISQQTTSNTRIPHNFGTYGT